MGNLITILVTLFGIFGFVLVIIRWVPIIKKIIKEKTERQESKIMFNINSDYNDSLHLQKFCNWFTPEVVEKTKSLCKENSLSSK